MKVVIVCGSKSDEPVVQQVMDVLKENNVPYEFHVSSAHREAEKTRELVMNSDADVFIAAAGLSAALPGFVASLTDKPVIGLPIRADKSVGNGLDALLSIAQLPPGCPVGCVGVDNAKNAALLAIRILKLKYPELGK